MRSRQKENYSNTNPAPIQATRKKSPCLSKENNGENEVIFKNGKGIKSNKYQCSLNNVLKSKAQNKVDTGVELRIHDVPEESNEATQDHLTGVIEAKPKKQTDYASIPYKQKDQISLKNEQSLNKIFSSTEASRANDKNSKSLSEKFEIVKIRFIQFLPQKDTDEPTFNELKKLLEITEQELFDANQKVQDLEETISQIEQKNDIALKELNEGFESCLVEQKLFIKQIQNILEENNIQNKNMVEIFRAALEADAFLVQENIKNKNLRENREILAQRYEKQIHNIKKLTEKNDLYISNSSKFLESLGYTNIKEMYRPENKLSEEINLQKRKIKMYEEELEAKIKEISKLHERIDEMENLLNGQEGLRNTTRKLIELQKLLDKCQKEKQEMERKYIQEKEELQEVCKIKQEEYNILEKKFIYSCNQTQTGNITRQELETDWNMIARDYIQKIENELMQAKSEILRAREENSLLKKYKEQSYEVTTVTSKCDLNQNDKENKQKNQEVENKKNCIKNLYNEQFSAITSFKFNPPSDHQHDNTRLKKEVLERLSQTFLSQNRFYSLSESTKKMIKEIFDREISNILSIYEKKLSTFKEKQLYLQDVLKSEIDMHIGTLKNLKNCLNPLVELTSMFEEVNPAKLNHPEFGKVTKGLLKRKQEFLFVLKEAKETQERLRILWNSDSLIAKVDIKELEAPFEDSNDINKLQITFLVYKFLEDKLKNDKLLELNEEVDSEEAEFMKRKISYLSQRVDSLTAYNRDLLQQVKNIFDLLCKNTSLKEPNYALKKHITKIKMNQSHLKRMGQFQQKQVLIKKMIS